MKELPFKYLGAHHYCVSLLIFICILFTNWSKLLLIRFIWRVFDFIGSSVTVNQVLVELGKVAFSAKLPTYVKSC